MCNQSITVCLWEGKNTRCLHMYVENYKQSKTDMIRLARPESSLSYKLYCAKCLLFDSKLKSSLQHFYSIYYPDCYSSYYISWVQVNILACPLCLSDTFGTRSLMSTNPRAAFPPAARGLCPLFSPSYARVQHFSRPHTIQRVPKAAGMPIVDFRSVPFLV